MNLAACAQDIGGSLTQHCQRLAAFAQHRHPSSPQDRVKHFVSLLFTSTAAAATTTTSSTFASVDDAFRGWYDAMRQRYSSEVNAAVESEDGAELRSLLIGSCPSGSARGIAAEQLPKLLGDFATNMSGVPALAKIDWKGLIVAFVGGAGAAGSVFVPKEDVADIFMRVYGDVSIDQNWFVPKPTSAAVKVHQVAYSTSPYLRLRFRISHPAVLADDDAGGGRTVRHLTVQLEDDDVLPGQSTAPVLRQWKDVLCNFYGIPELALQRSLLNLQKLVAEDSSGFADIGGGGGSKSAGPAAATSAATTAVAKKPDQQHAAKKPPSSSGGAQKADVGLLYTDPEAAMKNVDLNSADELTLQEFKDKMSEKFQEAVLKPGDPGYVYDKKVDFKGPKTSSGWDEDDD